MTIVFGFHVVTPDFLNPDAPKSSIFNHRGLKSSASDEEQVFIDLYDKVIYINGWDIDRSYAKRTNVFCDQSFQRGSMKFRYRESEVSTDFPDRLISEQITVVDGNRRLKIDRVQQISRARYAGVTVSTFEEYYVVSASSQKALDLMPAMISMVL